MKRRTVVLLLNAVVALALTGCSDSSTTETPPATPTKAPQPVVVTPGPPPPPGAVGPPVAGVTSLPPVPVEQPADFGGLVARVTRIEELPNLEANGPGERTGPGVGVSIEMRNESRDAVDLAGIEVNASY